MLMLANCSYFDPPTQGTVLWQAVRNYAELLSGVLLLKFLLCSALKYLKPGALVQKVLWYWFATTGQVLGFYDLLIAQPDESGESEIGNSVIPKDQHDRTAEAKYKRYAPHLFVQCQLQCCNFIRNSFLWLDIVWCLTISICSFRKYILTIYLTVCTSVYIHICTVSNMSFFP
jgi:hypothetical protein